jgi:hypothetical protein
MLLPVLASDCDPPIFASRVAVITAVHHHTQPDFLIFYQRGKIFPRASLVYFSTGKNYMNMILAPRTARSASWLPRLLDPVGLSPEIGMKVPESIMVSKVE